MKEKEELSSSEIHRICISLLNTKRLEVTNLKICVGIIKTNSLNVCDYEAFLSIQHFIYKRILKELAKHDTRMGRIALAALGLEDTKFFDQKAIKWLVERE